MTNPAMTSNEQLWSTRVRTEREAPAGRHRAGGGRRQQADARSRDDCTSTERRRRERRRELPRDEADKHGELSSRLSSRGRHGKRDPSKMTARIYESSTRNSHMPYLANHSHMLGCVSTYFNAAQTTFPKPLTCCWVSSATAVRAPAAPHSPTRSPRACRGAAGDHGCRASCRCAPCACSWCRSRCRASPGCAARCGPSR